MGQKLLIIVGPTASGKSALGVELARKFGGEIISADSRQVYRGLNIGTGKITKREMRGVPHHLLDVASPKKNFSVHQFSAASHKMIDQIQKRKKVAFLVGGTGFYIDVVVGRIALPDVPPNIPLRAQLEKKSVEELYALLGNRDPARARMMASPSERNNKRRLIRALEIAEKIGKSPRPHMVEIRSHSFDTLWIGIDPSLEILERKIEKRLLSRIRKGMIQEARHLKKGGLSYKRMEELGLEYRSLARFLQKKISKQEMIDELNRDIRRYAKKQMMYWQRNSEIKWFKSRDTKKIEKEVRGWLKT
jgi:tRNA dimethylallyltransferase